MHSLYVNKQHQLLIGLLLTDKILISLKPSCSSTWQCKLKVSPALHNEVIWCTLTAVLSRGKVHPWEIPRHTSPSFFSKLWTAWTHKAFLIRHIPSRTEDISFFKTLQLTYCLRQRRGEGASNPNLLLIHNSSGEENSCVTQQQCPVKRVNKGQPPSCI